LGIVDEVIGESRRDAVVFDSRHKAHQHVHQSRAGGRIGGLFLGLEQWLYSPILGQQQLLPRPLTLVGVACQLLDQIVDGWPAGAGKYRK